MNIIYRIKLSASIKRLISAIMASLICFALIIRPLDVWAAGPGDGTSSGLFTLQGHSVAVGSSFDLKYYLTLSDSVRADSSSYVKFTVGGKVQTAYPATTASGQSVYTCKVSAKELNDTVKAELVYKGNSYDIGNYSVKEYIDTLLVNDTYSSAWDISRAILNYGGYAQQYFAYNTGSLASQGLYAAGQNPVELLGDSSLTGAIKISGKSQPANADFAYIGASLTCKSDMTLKLYFENKSSLTKDEIVKKYNCYVAGSSYSLEVSATGNVFYMALNIPAANWDGLYTFTIQNRNSSDKIYVEYSPMLYVKTAMSMQDTKLKNLCKSIYLYNKAAKAYVNSAGHVQDPVVPEVNPGQDYVDIELDPLFAVPYVSTYYFNPKPLTSDNIQVPLYITDYLQSEYMYNNTSKRLDLIYEIDGVSKTIEDLPLGDYTLTIGQLTEGMHSFSVQVLDKTNGLKSAKLNNELWVVSSYDVPESLVYYVSQNDLNSYSINSHNSTDAADMINTRDGLTRLFADKQALGYRKVVLPAGGIYRIECESSRYNCISIPSYLTVDMNGSTFKLNTIVADKPSLSMPSGTAEEIAAKNEVRGKGTGAIVLMNDVIDAHLENGILEGDRYERQAEGLETEGLGEPINTVVIRGGKYCSLNNLTIKNTTGHTIYSEVVQDALTHRLISGYTNTAIIGGVEEASVKYCTSSMIDLTSYINWDSSEDFFYIGYPAGYRGIRTDSAYVYVSFYDNNQAFIGTVTACQFRKIAIPSGAKYARVTVNDSAIADKGANGIYTYSRHLGDYHSITNITFQNTRTCAIAVSSCNNLLIERVTYDNCGDSITPLPVDFEDGWDECQDVYYRNNAVLSNAPHTTGTIVDNAGYNHVYENCTDHSITVNGRLTGCVFRNMNDAGDSLSWDIGNKICNSYGRIYNNNCGPINFYRKDERGVAISDITTLGEEALAKIIDVKVKNCIIKNGNAPTKDHCYAYAEKITYEGCTFTSFAGRNATFRNCTLQPAGTMNDKLYFYNCTFKALDGSESITLDLAVPLDSSFKRYEADRLFDGCSFEGKATLGTENFHSGVFRNCEFEDLNMIVRVDPLQGQILFDNCTINSSADKFISTGPFYYSVDYFDLQFKNCNITHSGANLISFISMPGNGAKILFDGCTINKTSGMLVNWVKNTNIQSKMSLISGSVTFNNTNVDKTLGIGSEVDSSHLSVSWGRG